MFWLAEKIYNLLKISFLLLKRSFTRNISHTQNIKKLIDVVYSVVIIFLMPALDGKPDLNNIGFSLLTTIAKVR
jgi:hypothetical protein